MLPTLPKYEPRPVSLTVRLSERSIKQLKDLAANHNMSQADVLEILLQEAVEKNAPDNRKKRTRAST